jgi:lysophospholipase L1-like esterase
MEDMRMRVASFVVGAVVGVGTMMAQTAVPLPATGPEVSSRPQAVVTQTVAIGSPTWTEKTPVPLANTPQLPEPVPVPTKPELTRYLNRPELLKFCTAQVAELQGGDADMIFIGDSITQGWRGAGEEVWEKYFVPRHALDFGISGDQTQHVLWRLENYPIQRLHPKVAVVLIGTNNGRNTAEDVAAGVEAVVTKTQGMYPGIKVILLGIMPRGGPMERINGANVILKAFADGKSVYYLDLAPVMTPTGDGNFKGLGKDKLHPDAAGYQLWTDAMLPLLNTLLPPPVGEVPAAQ